MGKNKLRKFADLATMERVVQVPFDALQCGECNLRGRWRDEFFGNDRPIILELGCGKGEYTVGLARQNPDANYIGIDIKGARMWTGASQARAEGRTNVGFLRTDIELIDRFFAPGEVDGIWITFPDPQMKKARKRLTSTRFLDLFRRILRPDGIINLKTDSPFLFAYTSALIRDNSLPLITSVDDLHHSSLANDPQLSIRTHYEQQWIDRGLSIKYLSFRLPAEGSLVEPQDEIPHDTYRSYSRGQVQMPQLYDGTTLIPQTDN